MKLTIDQALQQGVAAHREGKLQDAERLYRAILQAQPNHPDANHNLGVLNVGAGQPVEAIPFFKSAVEANPQVEQFWLSHIDALIRAEQFDSAREALADGELAGVCKERLDAFLKRFQEMPSKGLEPSKDRLNRLLEHYQANRSTEAEELSIALTQEFPADPFGWKVLGALLQQTGRIYESLAVKRKVVELSPQDAEAHNNLGFSLRKLGRLEKAEASYRKAITLRADYAEAHYNLGSTLQELQRLSEANASYRQAIALKPDFAEAHGSLAAALQELGRLDDAEASYRKAIAVRADYFEAHYNLGIMLHGLDRLAEASTSYRLVIALKPNFAEAHGNLGIALKELGRLDEAEASYKQAIILKPEYADAHNNLGVTLQQLGRLDEAEASYRQAIATRPDFAEAHFNLGATLRGLGRLDESEAGYRDVMLLQPDSAEVHNGLGMTLQVLGRLREAEESYSRSITLRPDYPEAYNNLGATFQQMGKLLEANECYRQAIEVKPEYAEAYNNWGVTLKDLGRLVDAEASYLKAIALRPLYNEAYGNLLMLNGSMLFDNGRYKKYAGNFSKVFSESVTSPFTTWSHNRDGESLRIGFVSGDLRSHPVGYFLEGLLTQLQSYSVELFAYPTANEQDDLTARIRPLFHAWHSLVGLNDMEAAERIHRDGNHILIDLSGHTANNRLPVFARKPAPIQVSWLGYFASTGLPEMDYILGDPFVTPHDEASHFEEKIWQLPESYLCFTPPVIHLDVAPLPSSLNGFITFGCFNSLSRMTDEVTSVRAAILHAVPGSKLFLKDKQFDHEWHRHRILSKFASLDIAGDRLILEGASPRKEYLACYNHVDIALSPFPYGGGTTSVEGLWMGVPVITKKGNHFLSHLGESIAHNSGLSDWIASDKDDYVAKAVAYSSDVGALSDLRNGMREKILNTPLFDTPRFARNFEQAVRAMRRKIQ